MLAGRAGIKNRGTTMSDVGIGRVKGDGIKRGVAAMKRGGVGMFENNEEVGVKRERLT